MSFEPENMSFVGGELNVKSRSGGKISKFLLQVLLFSLMFQHLLFSSSKRRLLGFASEVSPAAPPYGVSRGGAVQSIFCPRGGSCRNSMLAFWEVQAG